MFAHILSCLKKSCLAAIAIAVSCSCSNLSRTSFFISPEGSDDNPGTLEKPFATIPRAMKAVRAAKKTAPISVFLRGGTHEIREKLVFTSADSGAEGAPITWASYPGEKAVISGGKKLPNEWKQSPGKPYYELKLPEAENGSWGFFSLFVNGESRTRARFPNWDQKVLRAVGREPGGDPRCALQYFPGDVNPEWSNLTDIDVVLLQSWTPTIHRITEIDPQKRAVRFLSSHGRMVDHFDKYFRYYLSNVFEALDQPGEWYLNRHSGVLYYYPMEGEDLRSAEVIVPVMKSQMVEFASNLTDDDLIHNLHFRDLSFRHLDGDMDRYNGVYRQGHMFLSAAVAAKGLRSSSFRRCEFTLLGEYAMELADGCRDVAVQQCHIHDIGAGGLQLGVTSLGALHRRLPVPLPGDITIDAAQAELSGSLIRREDCIEFPETQEAGSALFTFAVETPGTYVFETKVIAPDGGSDSFLFQVDDGKVYTYDTSIGGDWFPSPVIVRETGNKLLVSELAAGKHQVRISNREGGMKIASLTLHSQAELQNVSGEGNPRAVENLLIDNNCIHRLGTLWHGCYGIVNRFASLSKITHNDIFDIHWDAIALDARWTWKGEKYSHGNEVAYNYLHNLGLNYHTDAGGVYQFGPLDTHIHHNYVRDTRAYPYICGYSGIYLDQQSRGALIENNLVENVDWYAYFLHKGMDNVFRNNIGAFARDGLIRRGGLNAKWKANFMEAYHNIYVTDNDVALAAGWQPGEKPPIIRDNMYYSLSVPAEELRFANKSFAEWQADGQDKGSIIRDPGFRDPKNSDFRFRPGVVAFNKIGFVPFTEEIKKVGLYGDPAWCDVPKGYKARTPAPTWTPEEMIKFFQFDLDFDSDEIGSRPAKFRVSAPKDSKAGFTVSDEVPGVGGGKCLKCVDMKGLRKTYNPYMSVMPKPLGNRQVTFRFAARQSKQAPANFYLEFRDNSRPFKVGPSIYFKPDGSVVIGEKTILKMGPESWAEFEIRFGTGTCATGNYKLKTRYQGKESEASYPFNNPDLRDLRWLGFSAFADEDSVFYLDNLVFKFSDIVNE